MEKNQQSKNIFKVLFFLMSVVLIIVLVFSSINFSKNQKALKSYNEIEQRTSKFENRNELLSQIVRIDANVIFEGDYQNSINAYSELLIQTDDEELIAMINQRIDYFDEVTKMEDDGEDKNPYEMILQKNKLTINELKENFDSIQNLYSKMSDSLITQLNNLNDELMTQKSKSSSTSEKVKVISFKNDNGKLIHYLGEVENGKANGGGVGIWSTGSLYKGDWKNNKRHGNGTFEWADGERYEGEYVNDKRKGEGTYYWPSGDKYEGEWNNDVREGYGTLYDFDGNIRFEGGWVNDKPDR